ncbi:MAG: PHP domain-containing protein [Ruminococcaceae bacterium]|nr:PHP domain-containing protein [Oscillospiraceae bacterium]
MTVSELKHTLRKDYKYRIELHAHTSPVSSCGAVSPEDMVELYHQRNYHGIVVTNHFNRYNIERFPEFSKEAYIDSYLKAVDDAKKVAEKYGITVFVGAEIRFDENPNDYLLYGVDRDILSVCYDYFSKGLEAFRKEVKLPGSVLVHAHPFRNGMTRVSPELVDGIEILNLHPGHNSSVALSTRYAYETKAKIKTAGSDFHEKFHLGCGALLAKEMPTDTFELVELLKSGDYLLEISGETIVLP